MPPLDYLKNVMDQLPTQPYSKIEELLPNNWKPSSGNAQLSVADACGRVFDELEKMGVTDDKVVISTNVEPRLDSRPRSGRKEPEDVGVAVYWTDLSNSSRCIAVDIYNRVADNLAAIAATLDALRAIERHGGAEILNRAFAGFVALPAPGYSHVMQWWEVLNVNKDANLTDIKSAYRKFAMKHHPDRGGNADDLANLNKILTDGGVYI